MSVFSVLCCTVSVEDLRWADPPSKESCLKVFRVQKLNLIRKKLESPNFERCKQTNVYVCVYIYIYTHHNISY